MYVYTGDSWVFCADCHRKLIQMINVQKKKQKFIQSKILYLSFSVSVKRLKYYICYGRWQLPHWQFGITSVYKNKSKS